MGLSVAWELASSGLSCRLVDAGRIGRSASWAGAGVLPPARLDTALDPLDQLRGLSHQLHPQWAERLREQTGIDPEFQQSGGFYLARTPGEAAALMGQASYWESYGIRAERWTLDQLRDHCPNLLPAQTSQATTPITLRNPAVWWVPDEYQMRPPTHLLALRRACQLAGVELVEQAPVSKLTVVDDHLCGVEMETGSRWLADHVVLCCGAWASRFADPRGAVPDVYPVRGQVVLYHPRERLLPCIVNEGNRYLVPRLDGRIYVGSNEEEVGWVEATTEPVLESLRQWAQSLVPALAKAPIEASWSGLRPGSFDGFPYVGRSSQFENLYLATGHFRAGLHVSPGTAVVLSQLIRGERPTINLAPFELGRGRTTAGQPR